MGAHHIFSRDYADQLPFGTEDGKAASLEAHHQLQNSRQWYGRLLDSRFAVSGSKSASWTMRSTGIRRLLACCWPNSIQASFRLSCSLILVQTELLFDFGGFNFLARRSYSLAISRSSQAMLYLHPIASAWFRQMRANSRRSEILTRCGMARPPTRFGVDAGSRRASLRQSGTIQ